MPLLDDDARQPAKHDFDPATLVNSTARAIHVLDSHADALDRPREFSELHAKLAAQIALIRIAERLSATLADRTAATLLQIPSGTPLLRIDRIAYTYDDRPVELRVSLVSTSEHDYLSDLVKS